MVTAFPLILRNLAVRRQGKRVLGPLDLTVGAGGPTVVIGPNGSGKTTLLRVMHGIERLSAGEVAWAEDRPGQRAFVFQSPIVLRRSVSDNLAFPLRLVGRPRSELAAEVDHWLARTGLTALRDSPAPRLSGGERQKLAIARALICKPTVLFLDEPCANLDGHATREIEALLSEAAAAGTEVVMATHDMGQARRLARHVLFVLDGRIHEEGPAKTLLSAPDTAELAAFLRGDIVT